MIGGGILKVFAELAAAVEVSVVDETDFESTSLLARGGVARGPASSSELVGEAFSGPGSHDIDEPSVLMPIVGASASAPRGQVLGEACASLEPSARALFAAEGAPRRADDREPTSLGKIKPLASASTSQPNPKSVPSPQPIKSPAGSVVSRDLSPVLNAPDYVTPHNRRTRVGELGKPGISGKSSLDCRELNQQEVEEMRLSGRADAWNARGGPSAMQLRGNELREAERWLEAQGQTRNSEVDSVRKLVGSSRRGAAVRRARMVFVPLMALTVVTVGVSVSWLVFLLSDASDPGRGAMPFGRAVAADKVDEIIQAARHMTTENAAKGMDLAMDAVAHALNSDSNGSELDAEFGRSFTLSRLSGEVLVRRPAALTAAARAPDSSMVAVGDARGAISVWLAKNDHTASLEQALPGRVSDLAIDFETGRLWAVGEGGRVAVLTWAAGGTELERTWIDVGRESLRSLALGPRSRRIFVQSSTGEVFELRNRDGARWGRAASLGTGGGGIHEMLLGLSGEQLFVGGSQSGIGFTEVRRRTKTKLVRNFRSGPRDVVRLRQSSDGAWLLADARERGLYVAPMKGGVLRRGGFWLKGAPAHATAVHMTADAGSVVAGYADGSLYSWPLSPAARSRSPNVVAGEGAPVRAMTSSPDGGRLIVGYQTGKIHSYGRIRSNGWRLDGEGHEHEGEVLELLTLRASPWVLSASSDGSLRRWTIDGSGGFLRGAALSRYAGKVEGKPEIIAVGSDGARVALVTRSGAEQNVHLHALASGKEVGAGLEVSGAAVSAVRVLPQRSGLMVGREDGRIQFWDGDRSDGARIIAQEQSSIRLLADSPTPDWFLSANATGQLHLRNHDWKAGGAQGEQHRVSKEALLARFASPVSDVAVSPVSGVVVARSSEGLLGVWQVSARGYRDVEAPLNVASPASSVALDSTGDSLAVVRENGSLELWQRARHSFQQADFEGPTSAVAGVAWDGQARVLMVDMGRPGFVAYEEGVRGWKAVATTREFAGKRIAQIRSFSGGRRVVTLTAAGELLVWLRLGASDFRAIDFAAPAGHQFAFSRRGLVSIGPRGDLREWYVGATKLAVQSCRAKGHVGCAAVLSPQILDRDPATSSSLEQEVAHEGGLTHFRDI